MFLKGLAMKLLQTILLVFTLGALSGCVTRGEDFATDLSWIAKKTTTKAEVYQMLGKPMFVGDSSGRPTWTYGFYNYRLIGASKIKELKFYWTEDDRVMHYSYKSTLPSAREQAYFKKEEVKQIPAH